MLDSVIVSSLDRLVPYYNNFDVASLSSQSAFKENIIFEIVLDITSELLTHAHARKLDTTTIQTCLVGFFDKLIQARHDKKALRLMGKFNNFIIDPSAQQQIDRLRENLISVSRQFSVISRDDTVFKFNINPNINTGIQAGIERSRKNLGNIHEDGVTDSDVSLLTQLAELYLEGHQYHAAAVLLAVLPKNNQNLNNLEDVFAHTIYALISKNLFNDQIYELWYAEQSEKRQEITKSHIAAAKNLHNSGYIIEAITIWHYLLKNFDIIRRNAWPEFDNTLEVIIGYALQTILDPKIKLDTVNMLSLSCWLSDRNALCRARELLPTREDSDYFFAMPAVIQRFRKELTSLLHAMANGIFNIIGMPPCEWALYAVGSLGKDEMVAYSDFEFAIYIHDSSFNPKQSSYDKNNKIINYFKIFVFFLKLRVIGLGETPIKDFIKDNSLEIKFSVPARGFCFDTGMNVPFEKEFLFGDARFVFSRLKTYDDCIKIEIIEQNILTDLRYLFGSEKNHIIQENVRQEMKRILAISPETKAMEDQFKNLTRKLKSEEGSKVKIEQFRHYIAKLKVASDNVDRYGPFEYSEYSDTTGSKLVAFIDVKENLLRLPSFLISALALVNDIETPSTFERIMELKQEGVITQELADLFTIIMSIGIYYRQLLHLRSKSENDIVVLYQPMVDENKGKYKSIAQMPAGLMIRSLREFQILDVLRGCFYLPLCDFLKKHSGEIHTYGRNKSLSLESVTKQPEKIFLKLAHLAFYSYDYVMALRLLEPTELKLTKLLANYTKSNVISELLTPSEIESDKQEFIKSMTKPTIDAQKFCQTYRDKIEAERAMIQYLLEESAEVLQKSENTQDKNTYTQLCVLANSFNQEFLWSELPDDCQLPKLAEKIPAQHRNLECLFRLYVMWLKQYEDVFYKRMLAYRKIYFRVNNAVLLSKYSSSVDVSHLGNKFQTIIRQFEGEANFLYFQSFYLDTAAHYETGIRRRYRFSSKVMNEAKEQVKSAIDVLRLEALSMSKRFIINDDRVASAAQSLLVQLALRTQNPVIDIIPVTQEYRFNAIVMSVLIGLVTGNNTQYALAKNSSGTPLLIQAFESNHVVRLSKYLNNASTSSDKLNTISEILKNIDPYFITLLLIEIVIIGPSAYSTDAILIEECIAPEGNKYFRFYNDYTRIKTRGLFDDNIDFFSPLLLVMISRIDNQVLSEFAKLSPYHLITELRDQYKSLNAAIAKFYGIDCNLTLPKGAFIKIFKNVVKLQQIIATNIFDYCYQLYELFFPASVKSQSACYKRGVLESCRSIISTCAKYSVDEAKSITENYSIVELIEEFQIYYEQYTQIKKLLENLASIKSVNDSTVLSLLLEKLDFSRSEDAKYLKPILNRIEVLKPVKVSLINSLSLKQDHVAKAINTKTITNLLLAGSSNAVTNKLLILLSQECQCLQQLDISCNQLTTFDNDQKNKNPTLHFSSLIALNVSFSTKLESINIEAPVLARFIAHDSDLLCSNIAAWIKTFKAPNINFVDLNKTVSKSSERVKQHLLFDLIQDSNTQLLAEILNCFQCMLDLINHDHNRKSYPTPTLFAARFGGFGTFKLIYDRIVAYKKLYNPNSDVSVLSGTTLVHAAAANNPEILRFILNLGLNINQKTELKSTPLHFAVKSNAPSLVKILLQRGCKLNELDIRGRTPLVILIEDAELALPNSSKLAMMHMLLQAGASIFDPLQTSVPAVVQLEFYTRSYPRLHLEYYLFQMQNAIEANNPIKLQRALVFGAALNDLMPIGQTEYIYFVGAFSDSHSAIINTVRRLKQYNQLQSNRNCFESFCAKHLYGYSQNGLFNNQSRSDMISPILPKREDIDDDLVRRAEPYISLTRPDEVWINLTDLARNVGVTSARLILQDAINSVVLIVILINSLLDNLLISQIIQLLILSTKNIHIKLGVEVNNELTAKLYLAAKLSLIFNPTVESRSVMIELPYVNEFEDIAFSNTHNVFFNLQYFDRSNLKIDCYQMLGFLAMLKTIPELRQKICRDGNLDLSKVCTRSAVEAIAQSLPYLNGISKIELSDNHVSLRFLMLLLLYMRSNMHDRSSQGMSMIHVQYDIQLCMSPEEMLNDVIAEGPCNIEEVICGHQDEYVQAIEFCHKQVISYRNKLN